MYKTVSDVKEDHSHDWFTDILVSYLSAVDNLSEDDLYPQY